jgi:hypothetical protein
MQRLVVFDKICIHGFLSYKTVEQLLLNHERVPIIVAAHLLPLIPLDGNHMRGARDVGAMQGMSTMALHNTIRTNSTVKIETF